jgi:N-acetylglucosaminyldiphosphoundecaprenol N-acetyl-beta-D-mannosaminyltransferase
MALRESQRTSGSMNPQVRAELGPLPLDCLGMEDAVDRILAAVQDEVPPLHIVTANAQFLGLARRDPGFARVVQEAGMVVADGMPLLWLCRMRHGTSGARITGHDLVHASARLAAERGLGIGFLGAGPGIAEKAAQRLADENPGMRVAGIFQGNFGLDGRGLTPRDEEQTLEAIRASKPDILFVALGCPKQEMWISRHQRAAGVPVAIGIGGVLDVLAGRFKRAPGWAQRTGAEWAYRLAQDPRRLWKRYLAQDLPTLTVTAWETLRERANGKGDIS